MDDPNRYPDACYTGVTASLEGLHEKVDALRKELLGNGQPGRIQRLENDIESVKSKVWIFSGAAIGISNLAQYIMRVLSK